jgi:hypothetical protein
MTGLEQGLVFVLNAVSRLAKPILPQRVGSLPVWIIDLDELGWDSAVWEALVAGYPLASGSARLVPAEVRSATRTRVPLVQADWLAYVAMRPPHYSRLLGLPRSLPAFARRFGVDIDAIIRSGVARRAGLADSGEPSGARGVERHPAPGAESRGGALWLSHVVGGVAGEATTSSSTSGQGAAVNTETKAAVGSPPDGPPRPASHGSAETRFKAEGMRAIIRLGNGFPAFALFGADGNRLDRVQPGAHHAVPGDPSVGEAALGCLQCHLTGPAIGSERGAVPDEVSRLHAHIKERAALARSDADATRAAMLAAGMVPERRARGLSPPLALAQSWGRPVDATRLAAELGVSREALVNRLSRIGDEAPIAGYQLRQGTAQREGAMKLLVWLEAEQERGVGGGVAGSKTGGAVPAAIASPESKPAADGVISLEEAARIGRIELALWTDGQAYKAGDTIVFRAQASRDCYLTLVSVDNDGRATVMFPNDFERNNKIAAGQAIRVPSADAQYRFRLADPGQELLVGICSATHASLKSIVHNYDRLRFTVLGDWELFLREPPRLEVAGQDDAATDRPRPLRQRWRRRRKAQVAKRPEGPDVSARTAIVIEVQPAAR